MAISVEELERKFIGLEKDVEYVKSNCDDVPDLAKEVAQIKGILETQSKLMWFMVLTLFGMFIERIFT